MGNTPSHQHGTPSRHGDGSNLGRSGSQRRQNNLRLSMPQRNAHVSPQSSHPNSPSGRPGSPRRRRSLELPDLNRLSFTPAAPQPTTATNTSNHLGTTTARTPSTSGRRWQQGIGSGGGSSSGTSGANRNAPMSPPKDGKTGAAVASSSSPEGVTVVPVNDHTTYFPSQPIPIRSPRGGNADLPSPERRPRPELKPVSDSTPRRTGLTPPPPTVSATPQPAADLGGEGDGLVDVPIQWTGGGRTVLVTGNFADNWRGRIKLRKSTHDFNTVLRLAPGQYRLKFLVDDSWRCSKSIPTATDNDGTLVNYIEVEAPKSESDQVGWAVDDMTTAPVAQPDDSQWTNDIPPALSLYAYLEELPGMLSSDELREYVRRVPYFSPVPKPPQLPRILERVILNQQARPEVPVIDAQGNQIGGSDDNAVLPTPSSSVLGHLLASAVRGGSLGLATTTRYRKKYITTVLFRPIHEQAPQADEPDATTSPTTAQLPQVPMQPGQSQQQLPQQQQQQQQQQQPQQPQQVAPQQQQLPPQPQAPPQQQQPLLDPAAQPQPAQAQPAPQAQAPAPTHE